ncbi:hypothetical protein FHS96_005754 [Sphingomonas zeicaulis]|uniref:DUF2493 domain-containing protein n=1 Tax=Sphingomonas zeicaulis TaxID=1632740 RepID=UPI003D2165D6
MTRFTNFADVARYIADTNHDEAAAQTFEDGFIEHSLLAKMSIVDAPEEIAMPDPDQARAAVELMMATLFDVFRDTRMEAHAAELAWGFANSFHIVAKRVADREDDAARQLGELARTFDPSEIYANELEETQLLCQTLQGCREALECMRDHASEMYRIETGKPFSPVRGSRVSGAVTASMIDARDYLAARNRKRTEEFAPEGPIVVFSGGAQWDDSELLWNGLDRIKARIPEMILVTTAQSKGCDAIAHAWAAARGVKTIQFRLDRRFKNRAAFVRNERLLALKPVEAVVCEGTGVQANLAQRLRAARIPLHIVNNPNNRAEQAA